ncbi:MAG: signal peptidase II [Armatimonadetes bacterium]|nr:signal peptidase II [Armatimonadota bacterium]
MASDSIRSGSPARSFLGLAVAWVILDQITKSMVVAGGASGGVLRTIIPGWFELTHSRNSGAAFGMLNQQAGGRYILASVAVGALLVLIVCRRRVWALPRPQRLGLALVAAGALGNLIDRVFRGGLVVDFIRVYLPTGGQSRYIFPDFNVADIGVTCGMCLYVVHTLWCDWREQREQRGAPADQLTS